MRTAHHDLRSSLESALRTHLDRVLPDHAFRDVYTYAVFPPGKLFRPLLVASMALDTNEEISESNRLLASALELHHAYTLVHDDLPCMDNDLMRRGKASTHAAFGEWKALLAGDGLQAASYALVSHISSKRLPHLLRYMTWALGPQGLIQGQVLDLSGAPREGLAAIIKTHTLKTSRLIQVALFGAYLLNASPYSKKQGARIRRLGKHIGIVFQLLDDLVELCDESTNLHEHEINPFVHHAQEAFETLMTSMIQVEHLIRRYSLNHVASVIDDYYDGIQKKLDGKTIASLRLSPLMPLLRALRN